MSGERRSTYISIKNAIQNSENIQDLIDANSIEKPGSANARSMSLPEYTIAQQISDGKNEKRSTTRSPNNFISKRKYVPKNDLNAILKRQANEIMPNNKSVSISAKQDIQTQTSFVLNEAENLKPRTFTI